MECEKFKKEINEFELSTRGGTKMSEKCEACGEKPVVGTRHAKYIDNGGATLNVCKDCLNDPDWDKDVY